MERLFSPCTRCRDILDSQGRLEHFGDNPELPRELNLDVSIEELLSGEKAFTYANLYAMIGSEDTIAWLTPHAAIARTDGRNHGGTVQAWNYLDGKCGFRFKADAKEITALALSPEHLLEICDVVLRFLAASVVHSVLLEHGGSHDGELNNAPTLAYLMEQCQSLKVLTLNYLKMDESHCRALGDYSRPGLEIVLRRCKITSAGAGALAEALGRNQGPTKLELCRIDTREWVARKQSSAELETAPFL
jgi:hypothetical protein